MEEFRESLVKQLKENRPQISESSIKTYTSYLVSINKKMDGTKTLDFYKTRNKDIIKYIEENMKSVQSQKTLLSALFVITQNDEYRKVMMELCKKVNDNYKEQKLTDKQKEHRITFDEVKAKVEEAYNLLKTNPTMDNYKSYIAGGLSSGVFVPPRRSEYSNIKVRDYDKEKDNYLLKKKIYFNNYKTVKKYGQQTVDVPPEVMKVINKYLKLNTTEYMFPKGDGDKCMTNVDYNRLLQKLFGQSSSVDAFCSIYLSYKYKDLPSYEDMANTATAMGHTINTQLTDYVKKP
jgi:integrase